MIIGCLLAVLIVGTAVITSAEKGNATVIDMMLPTGGLSKRLGQMKSGNDILEALFKQQSTEEAETEEASGEGTNENKAGNPDEINESEESQTETEVQEESTEEPTESPAPPKTQAPSSDKKKETAKPAPPNPYSILVNKTMNYVVIYANGSPLRAFICSTGNHGVGTPTGNFKTTEKYRWRELFDGVYGQYATRIVGSILFHSVPYRQQREDTLLTEEFNKLGAPASAGCIRMPVYAVRWIYDNIPKGTPVSIVANEDPSPIPVEWVTKIPSNCNWDPTDYRSDNPWSGYEQNRPKPTEPETTESESFESESSGDASTATEESPDPESQSETGFSESTEGSAN